MTILYYFGISLCSTVTFVLAFNHVQHSGLRHPCHDQYPSSSLIVSSSISSSSSSTTTTAASFFGSRRLIRCSATSDTTTTTATSTEATISLVSQPVERSKYLELLQWLQQYGDAEINTKIDIQQSSNGDGCGVFVKEPVTQNELLFTIPRKVCVTLSDAKSDGDCGELFTTLMEKAGPGGNTVVMAGYMAKEYLVHLEDSKKRKQNSTIRANDDDSGNAGAAGSIWGPYFDTLPWTRGINNQEHCLFWDDTMIENLLYGSLCYNEATSLREEVTFAIRILDSIVSKPILLARNEITVSPGFRWPWQILADKEEERNRDPVEGLEDAIKGAFVCLLTRSFQDVRLANSDDDGDDTIDVEDEGDEEKLVPLLDLLQHSESPNVRHAMRTTDGTVEVRARCDIEAGSELFNQYRSEEEESMPYARFFTRFGFVPNVSEPIENLLRDKSSIFYPQKAEV